MRFIKAGEDWFVSTEFDGVPGIFSKSTYLHWYGRQLFDADGLPVAIRDEAFGEASLRRPADVVRPGLPEKDEWRDEQTTIGVVIERDILALG